MINDDFLKIIGKLFITGCFVFLTYFFIICPLFADGFYANNDDEKDIELMTKEQIIIKCKKEFHKSNILIEFCIEEQLKAGRKIQKLSE